MSTGKKILHWTLGIIISLTLIWATGNVFSMTSLKPTLANPNLLLLGIIDLTIALIPYFLLRKKYPFVATGILMGIIFKITYELYEK